MSEPEIQTLERSGVSDFDLDAVLALKLDTDGGLDAVVPESLSNAPMNMDAGRGAPFGGLMASLAVNAARQGLAIESPLRTLTVQYLAGARFGEPVRFTAESLRGGRSTHFAEVR